MGYTETTAYTSAGGKKNITKVDITLYEGRIKEAVTNYNDIQGKNVDYSKSDYPDLDKAYVKLNPTEDQMISTVGTHEGEHGTEEIANAIFAGTEASEPPAYGTETKAVNELIDQKNWQKYMLSHPVIPQPNVMNTNIIHN